jgi:hypothetical protein
MSHDVVLHENIKFLLPENKVKGDSDEGVTEIGYEPLLCSRSILTRNVQCPGRSSIRKKRKAWICRFGQSLTDISAAVRVSALCLV